MNEKKNIDPKIYEKVPDILTKKYGAMAGIIWASFLDMVGRKIHEQEMKEKKMIPKKEEEEN